MSLFDGKPIGRIEFGSKSRPPESHCPGSPCELAAVAEQERFWRAIRATAEGTNITSTPVSEGNMPQD